MSNTDSTAPDRSVPVLEARNIVKTYGGVTALKGVSLTLTSGHVHCLAGENGCGKSTLIKIISGAERPDSGEILIDGVSHPFMTPKKAIQLGIQVIYQDFSLFPNLTVAENIVLTSAVAQKRKTFSLAQSRPRAHAIVQELGLTLNLDAYVETLSVADRQLTAICRALINDARVIIMDEPTTALTHTEVDRLFALVRKLQARGVALMFVSHKLEEALSISQDITILRSGDRVSSGSATDFDRRSISRHMTGRDIDESRVINPPQYDERPVLEVHALTRMGEFENITFDLHRGEILGITGLLGSGRSEIAESLFGVLPAESGDTTVNGSKVHIRSIRDAIDAGIGYVPEDRLTQGLFLDKSIADNMIASSLDKYRMKNHLLDNKRIARTISVFFDKLHIKAPNVSAPVRSLSGGNAQRVVLAKWLANQPQILILNGPTVGVDVGSKEEILTLLRAEAAHGMGLIVISDDVPELVSVCNRIIVIQQGRLTSSFTGDEIQVDAIQERMSA
ncbi:sugar ABC transporter ATP-binding protein [Cryobacterium sp. Y50]|uniref:sugar ABC transporter ATP-binding protein n=1 Tax=Cryobacterium sp. Y50 TaxID=2048286 RepID=UPI000CE2CBE6|nr:sugar ABC transporter ATP-binding protein [Cryobacterium sp. Y50]